MSIKKKKGQRSNQGNAGVEDPPETNPEGGGGGKFKPRRESEGRERKCLRKKRANEMFK